MRRILFSALVVLGLSAPLHAQLVDRNESTVAEVQANLTRLYPQVPWGTPEPSDIANMYLVPILGSSEMIYVSQDGRHLFTGRIFRIDGAQPVDVVEEREMPRRAAALAELDLDDAIVYTPEEKKARIYVFTDISCGYCRQLHHQMDEMLEAGIEVVYLAYPRDTRSATRSAYLSMTGIWCADDRAYALDRAFNGADFTPETCNQIVREQYELGVSLGVNSTPHIFFEDGTKIPGAQPTEALVQALGI